MSPYPMHDQAWQDKSSIAILRQAVTNNQPIRYVCFWSSLSRPPRFGCALRVWASLDSFARKGRRVPAAYLDRRKIET